MAEILRTLEQRVLALEMYAELLQRQISDLQAALLGMSKPPPLPEAK